MERLLFLTLAIGFLTLVGCGSEAPKPILTSQMTAEQKKAIAEHDKMIDSEEGGNRSNLKKKK